MNDTVSYQPTIAPTRPLAEIPRSRGDDYATAVQGHESRMIVGPGIKLKGEISHCDILIVEGEVEATLESKNLEIAAGGTFSGTATVESAEINGDFDGTLTVSGLLRIHGTGRLSGKIRYGRIEVEAGGELSGDIVAQASEKSGPQVVPAGLP